MRTIATLVIVSALAQSAGAAPAAAERKSAFPKIDAVRKQMMAARNKILEIESNLMKTDPEAISLRDQIKALQKQLDDRMLAAAPELADLRKKYRALSKQLRTMVVERARQRKRPAQPR